MRSKSLSLQSSSIYWDKIGAEWAKQGRDALWRSYCDARKNALLSRWLTATKVRRLLKTDAFDEAVAAGLYPKLRLHARHVIGIDVSPVIIQAAQARYPEFDILEADIRSLPFEDGYFDVVLSFSTLDHFDSRDSISQGLEELHRVLAPKGLLLITLDNAMNPTVAFRNQLPYDLVHRLGLVPYHVGKTCGARALTRLLSSNGFRIHRLTYVEHCPRMPAVQIARVLTRFNSTRASRKFFRVLDRFERLEHWPTRAQTGHYVAALVTKP